MIRVALAALFLCLSVAASRADAVGDFYKGKTVIVYIGTGPGGGYDVYGRLVARHIGRLMPGTPNVVAQNMPGASSLTLTNYLFNKAPKDGTALGIINQAMPIEQYLQTDGIAYDAQKFNWIGRVTSAVEMAIVWHTVPIATIDDVRRRETIMGGTGPTSSTVFVPYLLDNLAGMRFKVISGFDGTTEIGLAMERGEVEGSATPLESLKSYRANWIAEGKIRILVQYTQARDPELPQIPTMVELGRDEEGRKILSFYASGAEIGRSIMAPPGIAPDRVTALRRAFDAMLADRQFLAEVAKSKMEVKPMTGEKLQTLVAQVSGFPPALIAKARKAREKAE